MPHRPHAENQTPNRLKMPFVKSNWACEPALAEDGAFEFGKAFTLRELSLQRGSQTRPCFLHGAQPACPLIDSVLFGPIDGSFIILIPPLPSIIHPTVSSEAECRVKTLTLIASAEVEVLDVFALLGSLESMDYRKLGTVQGSRMEDGRVFFNVNTAPFPPMWQLQLKVSSRAPAVVVHELSVQVDKTAGGAGIPSATAATSDSMSSSSSKPLADTAMFHTGRSSLGASLNASATGKSRHGLGATMATTADFDASTTTTTSLGLSRSRAAAAATSSLAITATKPSASAASTTTSSTHPLAASTTTTALASLGGARAGATSTALSTGGASSAETAAVASVLNAVCEKMVGVVSEKTKVGKEQSRTVWELWDPSIGQSLNLTPLSFLHLVSIKKAYLAKAGKRTERRVLGESCNVNKCLCSAGRQTTPYMCPHSHPHPPASNAHNPPCRQDGQAGGADSALRRRAATHHRELVADRGDAPGVEPGAPLAPRAGGHVELRRGRESRGRRRETGDGEWGLG